MAYGSISRPGRTHSLQPRLYPLPSKLSKSGGAQSVSQDECYALTLPFSADLRPPVALETAMRQCFNNELEAGSTYPQRGPMSRQEFSSYFLANDLIVGLLFSKAELQLQQVPINAEAEPDLLAEVLTEAIQNTSDNVLDFHGHLPTSGMALQLDVASLIQRVSTEGTVDWESRWRFAYYIKPNYPGRSSHLCNAGFLVPPSARGSGLGSLAGLSFVHYGPAAGYIGSIFNLVYVSNVASMRIWESLGFEQVGRIRKAGLLKTGPDGTEEFVDAWIVQGDFDKLTKIQEQRAAERLDQAAQIEKKTI
ncbi:hypothetical protein IE81DRAFT_324829 [Ceraceosorus guamensis]|uniref:N-acetyltransferase domain-containing protein n=1 Tax=Ceraceosorus guamensis TaxID=1522189 RepID=A0A316VUG0_9BASI|nr:hypothetical protein IE81DRAFT_324829 [Ceraceosorus guamensis]PWN41217.1 hypothetical protein IE81DRAFT_324829 [Ceraceosorus guamensis]